MSEFPSNSDKLKEASLVRERRNDIQPLETKPLDTSNDVTEPKKSPSTPVRSRKVSTFKQVFAALFPDGFSGIKDRVIWDMFVPRMQTLLHDGWDDVGDIIFNNGRGPRTDRSHTPYNSIYDDPRKRESQSRTYRPQVDKANYWYRERIWNTREEAEQLRYDLYDILRRYRKITLLDYCELCGFDTYPGQDDYGWINIDSARIERDLRHGWVLVLPRPVEIN